MCVKNTDIFNHMFVTIVFRRMNKYNYKTNMRAVALQIAKPNAIPIILIIGTANILPVHQMKPPKRAIGWKYDVSLAIETPYPRPNNQMPTHIINWKNIPSPISYCFTGMKFDPKPKPATAAAIKPSILPIYFSS